MGYVIFAVHRNENYDGSGGRSKYVQTCSRVDVRLCRRAICVLDVGMDSMMGSDVGSPMQFLNALSRISELYLHYRFVQHGERLWTHFTLPDQISQTRTFAS